MKYRVSFDLETDSDSGFPHNWLPGVVNQNLGIDESASNWDFEEVVNEPESQMNMEQRSQAVLQAAEAFREAWALMDRALGWEASCDVAERGLSDIIKLLETPEFLGVGEPA